MLEANLNLGFTSDPKDLAAIQDEVFPPATADNKTAPADKDPAKAAEKINRDVPIERVWRQGVEEANAQPKA